MIILFDMMDGQGVRKYRTVAHTDFPGPEPLEDSRAANA